MNWTPSTKEIESVEVLEASKRYDYLIKKIADQEKVWSLWQEDGWALAGDNNGREAVPIWPHEQFARLAASGSWVGYQPKVIELDAWLSRWIAGMEKDNRLVAVFPTMNDKGVFVEPAKFAIDLRSELQNYE